MDYSKTTPARTGSIGVLTASSGSFSNGEEDVNSDGSPQHITGMTGTYGSVDTNGRFTATIVVPSLGTSHNAFYMVSSSEMFMVTTDDPSGIPVMSGEVKQRSGTFFSNSSLSGNGVFYQSGLNGGGSGGSASIGLSNANGSGSMTITSLYDGGARGTLPTLSLAPTRSLCMAGRHSAGPVAERRVLFST